MTADALALAVPDSAEHDLLSLFVRRLCENSPDDLNDGIVSASDTEAFHGAVYRRHRPTAGDIVARVS